ncbi:glycosyltransferase family 10 domain-containing protein [Shimia sp.]|uniref:glycosyltransferase family 10 domain-containing protein n=1 Tax=Shimia sp. TaxID=1954381 RepID=UPI0035630B9E
MNEFTPAVAVLPYGTKLGLRPGRLPLGRLNWPLGQPERLLGRSLRDLDRRDHLLIYPSGTAHMRPYFGTRARVSMMVVEPTALHGRHLQRLKRSHRRFHRVLSANEAFLDSIPNGIFLPFGTTWVPDWQGLDVTKRRMTSLIASSKRDLEGHVLRHQTVEWAAGNGIELDVMGRGYRPFERKSDGLAPYRFSVVIENVREANYFTEKLVDCILCDTVPIYWGCPNPDRFFDTRGMILCDTAEDVRAAVAGASEGRYRDLLPALRGAKEQAAHWAALEPRAAQAVLAA